MRDFNPFRGVSKLAATFLFSGILEYVFVLDRSQMCRRQFEASNERSVPLPLVNTVFNLAEASEGTRRKSSSGLSLFASHLLVIFPQNC